MVVWLPRYLQDLDKEEDDLIRTRQSIDTITVNMQKLAGDIQALRLSLSAEAKAIRMSSQ